MNSEQLKKGLRKKKKCLVTVIKVVSNSALSFLETKVKKYNQLQKAR